MTMTAPPRKPRLCVVNDLAYVSNYIDFDAIDDDYLVSIKYPPRSVGALRSMTPDQRQKTYPHTTHITLEQTDRHEDAMDWFSDVIASRDNWQDVAIWLNTSRAKVRERYPWTNEFWHSICVWINPRRLGKEFSTAVYPLQGYPRTPADIKDKRNPTTGLFNDSDDSAIECSLLLFNPTHEQTAEFHKLNPLFSFFLLVYSRMGESYHAKVFRGRHSSIMSVVKQHLTPESKWFAFVERRIERVDFVHLGACSEFDLQHLKTHPVPYAGLRWPHYHQMVVDVALVLLTFLPVYVVLEIIDWLPKMALWSHVRKIRLLESMRDSIDRALSTRPVNGCLLLCWK